MVYRCAPFGMTRARVLLAILLQLVILPWPPPSAAGVAAAPAVAVPGILVLVDREASPFGAYLSEVLHAEGVQDFEVVDLGGLTAGILAGRRAVLLGEARLASAQIALLDGFVSAGGGLVAMRPAAGLDATLGVARQGATTAEGYLRITDQEAGTGLYPGTMQFHGEADHYSLAGAAQIAELYSTRDASAGRPAITLATRGAGKAALFAYDLARSVALTRQGNPASANLDTDGDGVVRSIDLYRNWVDLERTSVPQADMQQRLLVRLIEAVTAQPLPRLWYFPGTTPSVLVATSDAHGQADADYQVMIDALRALDTTTTFYLQALPWAQHPAADTVEGWRAQGFAFGPHPYTSGEVGYTLAEGYTAFASWYPTINPRTVRTHQLGWRGWTTAASDEAAHGAALDLNFYQYGSWLTANSHAGYLSGSGRPMRFIAEDGTLLPIYQQHTLLVDEQVGPAIGLAGHTLDQAIAASRAAIDASVSGYHTPITTQYHVGYWTYDGFSEWVIETARYARQRRGLPSLTAEDWLTFTEQRVATAITTTHWSAATNVLSFDVAAGGPDQTILLPARYRGGQLLALTSGGQAIGTSRMTVNGADFVAAPAATGSYVATYEDTAAPTVVAVAPSPGAGGVAGTPSIGVTFSEPMDRAATQAAFALNPPVPGNVAWDAQGTALTFIPNAPLAGGTTYSVTVGGGARDRAGNSLAAAQTWSFTTASMPVAIAAIVVSPANGGAVTGGGGYQPGTTATLTARPNPGFVFVGWTVDGRQHGWASTLTLTMDANRSVRATFGPVATFPDVGSGRADYIAIVALASRGTIRGYQDGRYGPDDGVQRAQMAALIARATSGGPHTPPASLAPPACLVAGSWDCEDWGNSFTDRSGDHNLWRNAGALQHYGVTLGYSAADCTAKGRAYPCYGPSDPVTYAQTITFIARMMKVKGYWVAQPGAPLPFAGVPGPHQEDVRTFAFYTQALGGVPAPPGNWNAGATRGWFALALWQALNSYFGTDGLLPDGRPAGGLAP